MATYKAQFDATQSDDLQQKVQMAVEKKARTIAAGGASAERNLAYSILSNPSAYRERFTVAVVSQADAVNPNDVAIDTAVGVVWPFFAIGLVSL